MEELLQKVYDQQDISRREMNQIAEAIFSGQLSEIQIAAFFMALKIKGETVSEMAGFAEVVQQLAVRVRYYGSGTIDTCGTGGDKSFSFNVSTTIAFIVAAAGIPVAKHGNRSVSSKSGSADTMEALGINLFQTVEQNEELLNEIGLTFLYAPEMHPNMKYVMPVRKTLKTPTIMNLVGPLVNPVKLDTQLMGTYRGDLIKETAEVLRELGRERAIVIHGAYGMDEANLAGISHYALLENEEITMHELHPEDVGLSTYTLEDIRGGNAEQNADILRAVLKGEPGAYLDTVLLNSGLAFYANGKVNSVQEGIDLARNLIQSGSAYNKLEQLIHYQTKVA